MTISAFPLASLVTLDQTIMSLIIYPSFHLNNEFILSFTPFIHSKLIKQRPADAEAEGAFHAGVKRSWHEVSGD